MKINYKHTLHTHNPTSAEIILPYVFNIVNPQSVLDIGCGNGSWLKVCKDLGVKEIFGVDGIQVPTEELMIGDDKFLKYDLTKKLDLERKFDIVISLEVAEHLSEDSANTFIDSLTKHASVVLFSAAIPEQGGQYHLNEQWPKYWQEKFKNRGFQTFDILRTEFWDNENVLWWYKQNMILFVNEGESAFNLYKPTENVLSLIHPQLYRKKSLNQNS
ncbi:MAG: methyltransferase domain-containing protein [Flavobacteriaceae bacterium]|nr:methyltransferase domain-containing protein [Flavobacteriaceae bacterium]